MKIITVYLLFLSSLMIMAGQESQSGGSVIIDGKQYLLADTQGPTALPHGPFQIGPRLNQELHRVESTLLNVFKMEFHDFFEQEVFHPAVEWQFVQSLPQGCPIQSSDFATTFPSIGCSRSKITYFLPDQFSQLTLNQQALELIRLRLEVYAPLNDQHLAAGLISTFHQSLGIIFRCFIDKNGPTISEDELLLLNSFRSITYTINPSFDALAHFYLFSSQGTFQVIDATPSYAAEEGIDTILVNDTAFLLSAENINHIPKQGKIQFGPRFIEKMNQVAQTIDRLHFPIGGTQYIQDYVLNGNYFFKDDFNNLNCHFAQVQHFPNLPNAQNLQGVACTDNQGNTYINPQLYVKLPLLHRVLLIALHERLHYYLYVHSSHFRDPSQSEITIMQFVYGIYILFQKHWSYQFNGDEHYRYSRWDRGLTGQELAALNELPRKISQLSGDRNILQKTYQFTREGGVLINSNISQCNDCIIGPFSLLNNSIVSGEKTELFGATVDNSKLYLDVNQTQKNQIRNSHIIDSTVGSTTNRATDIQISGSTINSSNLQGKNILIQLLSHLDEVTIHSDSEDILVRRSQVYQTDIYAKQLSLNAAKIEDSYLGEGTQFVLDVKIHQSDIVKTLLLGSSIELLNRTVLDATHLKGQNIKLEGTEIVMLYSKLLSEQDPSNYKLTQDWKRYWQQCREKSKTTRDHFFSIYLSGIGFIEHQKFTMQNPTHFAAIKDMFIALENVQMKNSMIESQNGKLIIKNSTFTDSTVSGFMFQHDDTNYWDQTIWENTFVYSSKQIYGLYVYPQTHLKNIETMWVNDLKTTGSVCSDWYSYNVYLGSEDEATMIDGENNIFNVKISFGLDSTSIAIFNLMTLFVGNAITVPYYEYIESEIEIEDSEDLFDYLKNE